MAGKSQRESKRELKPKLRFPEFQAAPGWSPKQLGSICEVNPENDGLPESFVYIDLESVEAGSLVARKRISRSDAPSRAQRVLADRDVIFQMVRPYQRNNLFFDFADGEDYVASTGYAQLRAHISSEFLFQLIHENSFVERVIAKCTGSNYPAINSADLAGIAVSFPPSPAEQRKIAECLSSLDELIGAESRKLEALQAHKKGLMQQLFPREGETLPRLRFPEFKHEPEWEPQELGGMTTKVGSGITPTGGEKNYWKSGRQFIRSQNVGWGCLLLDDVAFIDEETHSSFDGTELELNDVLLNITGASIGRSAIADSRIVGGNVNQHVCIIRTNRDELNPTFLNQYLISQNGQSQIDSFQAGGNRQGLNFGQIRSFTIPVPKEEDEQSRIAQCLSSVDEVLAQQWQAIESLRTHKKGLMQQLFPSMEDAHA